jgi:hypothetical protein
VALRDVPALIMFGHVSDHGNQVILVLNSRKVLLRREVAILVPIFQLVLISVHLGDQMAQRFVVLLILLRRSC